MLHELMDELGVAADACLMIGDTTPRPADGQERRCGGLAVSFGAHPVDQLLAEAPLACVHTPAELRGWLEANVRVICASAAPADGGDGVRFTMVQRGDAELPAFVVRHGGRGACVHQPLRPCAHRARLAARALLRFVRDFLICSHPWCDDVPGAVIVSRGRAGVPGWSQWRSSNEDGGVFLKDDND